MTTTYRLPNGLTVVLQESHLAPVVAFQAWVGVGSVYEPEELAGIAHVFEHMLFKGTARRGVGKIAQEVEGAGGDINAWTSFDETVYHLVLASRFFDTGLDIITDALRNSSFDPGELERELKVVLEEVKQGEDSPSRVATQLLFSTAYARHPYRRPVIGYSRTVEKFQRPQLLEFFRRHYVPSNITLVVVGDFQAEQARERIAALWADAPTLEKPALPPTADGGALAEPEQTAARVAVQTGDVQEAHLALAFHIPGIVHADTGALDVAAIVLGQGDSSRLVREVKRNRQLVSDVYAYSYTPRDPGLLVAGATLPPQQIDEALDAILDELFRAAHEEPGAAEVEKAKTIVESDVVYQKETVQGQARKLGFFQSIAGSLAVEEEYNRQVRAVTPARVREVAARYLRPERATLALLGPASLVKAGETTATVEARLRERLDAAWKRAEERHRETDRIAALARAKASAPAAATEPVIREELPGGARLLVYRDTSVPLVALRAVWVGGLRAEDERSNGINNLLSSLITRGTRTRGGDEIAHEIESMAGAIGGFSGRNSFGVRAELLARHWERGLDVMLDCILHPTFDSAELEKERRQVLEDLRTQEDNVSSVAFRLFSQAMYPHHPYRLDVLGSPESVAGLTRKQLVDYYARVYPTSRMTIAVVGDVDPAKVRERIVAALDRAHAGEQPPRATPPVEPRPDPMPDAPREVVKHLNKQQAHLVVGFPGTTMRDGDRFALEVLSTILSGQGGRLFVELRDKRGLAYRVSAFTLEGVDPGYFAVYMATSPENLEVARAGIREELDKVIDHPVDADELERAKRYLVGAHDISLQRRSSLASTLAFNESYGLGWDEYRRYGAQVMAVTAADVQRVARRYLDRQRVVVAVVKQEEAGAQPRLATAEAPRGGKAAHTDGSAPRAAGTRGPSSTRSTAKPTHKRRR